MNKSKYPSQTAPRVVVRLSSSLKRKLKKIAEKEGRSMNSQVVQILEKSVQESERNEV